VFEFLFAQYLNGDIFLVDKLFPLFNFFELILEQRLYLMVNLPGMVSLVRVDQISVLGQTLGGAIKQMVVGLNLQTHLIGIGSLNHKGGFSIFQDLPQILELSIALAIFSSLLEFTFENFYILLLEPTLVELLDQLDNIFSQPVVLYTSIVNELG
jgi:hypothetical protein